MDKLTKLLSKITGDKPPAPLPPSVQQQNLPTVTAQVPAPNSFIASPASPAPSASTSTPPVYTPAPGTTKPSPQEQFFKAIKEERYEDVKQLLLLTPPQIDISQLDPKTGMSALRIALKAKNDRLAQLLVAQGQAPINAETRGGETPLISAAQNGLLKTSKSLLRRGAEVNDHDVLRKTALHYGCENDIENVELIQALLDAGADKDKADTLGNTPLSIACHKGHVNVVKLLLERGAVASSKGKDKNHTPLLEACHVQNGKAAAEIIDVLLARGASLDCYSERGETPFMVAVEYRNLAALKALVANLHNDSATVATYLNKPNDKGETAWAIVNSPAYNRPELGYVSGYMQMVDDIKTLLINYGATQ